MIDMTEEEMRKEIRRVLRQVGRNVKEIEAAASVSSFIPTYAVEKVKQFRKDIRKLSIKRATGRTLRNYYRDINYIAGLKSATLEGAQEMSWTWQPIKAQLDEMTEEQKKKFWNIWDKAYSENALLEHFKYEIMSESVQRVFDENNTDFGQKVVDIFEETQLELRRYLGREPSEQEIASIFISKLSNI